MWKAEESGNLTCLRCGGKMVHAFTGHIQLGKTSLALGSWPNLFAGAMPAAVYCCQECRRLEFFALEEGDGGALPQKTCPVCGKPHDFDYPRCPFCRHEY